MSIFGNTIKESIVEKLSELAKSIILKIEPFEKIKEYQQVTPYLRYKFLEYADELSDDLKQKILYRDIDFSNYLIKNAILGFRGKPFSEQYPEHKKTALLFEDWIRKKEQTLLSYSNKYVETDNRSRIKIEKIIKSITLDRKKDFCYDKTIGGMGLVTFSSKFLHANKVYIAFDKGTKRSFFDVFLGLENPRFFCGIANFFGRSQSNFNCRNYERAKEQVNAAVDIIDILLQQFTEKITSVLQ